MLKSWNVSNPWLSRSASAHEGPMCLRRGLSDYKGRLATHRTLTFLRRGRSPHAGASPPYIPIQVPLTTRSQKLFDNARVDPVNRRNCTTFLRTITGSANFTKHECFGR